MRLALHVSDLTIKGDDGHPILNVNQLAIASGESVGVRGPSGAGKSTLLYALAGLVPIGSGKICWGDANIERFGERQRADFRRRHIGMIFQDFLLFEELSALGNAALAAAFARRGRRDCIHRNAASMLERLGLSATARRNVTTFSGGERQRVSVARALSNDPAIILADEPTASLDRDAGDRLVGDLTALVRAEGKTLIAVSHDTALLSKMDRVIDVVDGAMVAEEPARA